MAGIESGLCKILSMEEVWGIAKETGFMERANGGINPFDLLSIVAFGSSGSLPPSLSVIASELDVSRAAVNNQLTKDKGTEFVSACLNLVLSKCFKIETGINAPELFAPFNRVLIYDSSGWNLPEGLASSLPGCGGSGSKAGCKIQLCLDYKHGKIVGIQKTAGTLPDQKYSRSIPEGVARYDLILFDLGYSAVATFCGIENKEAFFVARHNTCSNIWQINDGKFIKCDLAELLKNQEGIASVELSVYLRGEESKDVQVRLVAFRAPEELANLRRKDLYDRTKKNGRMPSKKELEYCNWSLFITNAPEDLVPGRMIRSVYRVR